MLLEYSELKQSDLPRVKRHIVMSGSMERHEWYKSVMSAYFSHLLNSTTDDESKQFNKNNVIPRKSRKSQKDLRNQQSVTQNATIADK